MKRFPFKSSVDDAIIEAIGKRHRPRNNDLQEIVFDDQPLESVLYGQAEGGKTSASLFGRAREFVNWIREADRAGDMGTVIDICKVLAAGDTLISLGMCSELAVVLTRIVPYIPNPVLRYDLSLLCPLLEKIWELALERRNEFLLQRIAGPSFRCHEHYGQFGKAQRVLRWLLENSRRTGNQREEALTLNNLGFEYLLEGRLQEALHDFEEAANLFQAIDIPLQSANSRTNCWICKFESSDMVVSDQVEDELRSLEKTLTRANYWQARKPMILLARIAEQRGDLKESILWVKKAIQACKGSGTRYPETDAQYLQRLKETFHSRSESVP
jgi:tetratricopeptide (TPR) repeat protein